MTEDQVGAVFTLAQIPVLGMQEIPNQYWPDHPSYDDVRTPWWLVRTSVGVIKIGMRKRVFSVNWKETPIRKVVTKDNVTKDEKMVHAWSTPKLVEYMMELSMWINDAERKQKEAASAP